MKIFSPFAALALLSAAPLPAQVSAESPSQAPTGTEAARPPAKTVPVAFTTSAGRIVIAVEVERAPVTAANFLRYVDQKRFDGVTFYRSFTYASDPTTGFIQGGTSNDPKRILKGIAHEATSRTGLTHDDGAVSMARAAPGSANGDFFVIMGKMPGLDANPAAASAPGADTLGYAVFGHVVEGMDIVRAISAAPKSPTAGVGVMKGQMLAAPVRITSARRVTLTAAR